jgi:hypothetical protein
MKTPKKTLTFFFILTILFLNTANAQWEQCPGKIYGGNVHAFLYDGTDLYATAGRIFHSSDDGGTWSVLQNSPFTVAPNLIMKDQYIFAGSDPNGVFRSSDHGVTWTEVNEGLTDTSINCLTTDGTNLFIGTYSGGVFRSSDNGAHWIAVNSGLPVKYIFAIASIGNTIFAGTNGGGLYTSTTKGATWNKGGIPDAISSFLTMGSSIFCSTGFDYPIHGGSVWRSTNKGSTWTNTSIPNGKAWSLASIGTAVFAGTENGIYMSTDNGDSWTEANAGLSGASAQAFAVNGKTLFAGLDGRGVFKSTDNGSNWIDANNGFDATGHTLFNNADVLYATGQTGISRSSNNGDTWISSDDGLTGNTIYSLAFNGANIFAASYRDGYLSDDKGITWSPFNSYKWFNAFAFIGTNIFAATTGDTVVRSTDNGASWDFASTGITSSDMDVIASTGTTLLVAGQRGIYRSTDSAGHWSAVKSFTNNYQYQGFAIFESNIFLFSANIIFRSTNDGKSWTTVSNGPLKNVGINAITLSGKTLFAATSKGVFSSWDNGTTWMAINTGLSDSMNVSSLAADNTYLFADNGKAIMWRRPLLQLSVTPDPSAKIPSKITLDQNYPNPFTSSTSISFSLPHTENISLKIYDQLGNEVANLVSEYYESGKYHADWNAEKFPAGMYYSKIRAGSFSETKGLIKN